MSVSQQVDQPEVLEQDRSMAISRSHGVTCTRQVVTMNTDPRCPYRLCPAGLALLVKLSSVCSISQVHTCCESHGHAGHVAEMPFKDTGAAATAAAAAVHIVPCESGQYRQVSVCVHSCVLKQVCSVDNSGASAVVLHFE